MASGSRNESISLMSKSPPSGAALRVSALAQNAATPFLVQPDAAAMVVIAEELALSGLRKLRFGGEVRGHGATDWLLSGTLGATVTQPCGVTLEPVTTRIDVPVRRLYVRDLQEVDAPEVEMPEDDEVEPLTQWIDPEAVMIEALSLSLPLYPRADHAEPLPETVLTEPGAAPLTAQAMKPFAGLAALKDKLEGDDDS